MVDASASPTAACYAPGVRTDPVWSWCWRVQPLALTLILGTLACGRSLTTPRTPDDDAPRVAATAVSDTAFSAAVHRLLQEGDQTAERSSLLAGVVKRQLAHAAAHFDQAEPGKGARAGVGAIYLVRTGESRPDMFDSATARARTCAIP